MTDPSIEAKSAEIEAGMCTPVRSVTKWTPEQFWEYVAGYTGEFEAGAIRDMMRDRGLMLTPQQSGAGFSAGGLDNLLSRLDQGAAYQGYPEGFGFSLTQLAGDAATVIRRLRTALAPKGAAPEREVFRCNCPHEVRAGCSETKCPHYAVPRAERSTGGSHEA